METYDLQQEAYDEEYKQYLDSQVAIYDYCLLCNLKEDICVCMCEDCGEHPDDCRC